MKTKHIKTFENTKIKDILTVLGIMKNIKEIFEENKEKIPPRYRDYYEVKVKNGKISASLLSYLLDTKLQTVHRKYIRPLDELVHAGIVEVEKKHYNNSIVGEKFYKLSEDWENKLLDFLLKKADLFVEELFGIHLFAEKEEKRREKTRELVIA